MQSSLVGAACLAAIASVSLAGCTAFDGGKTQGSWTRVARYGGEADVLATVAAVKRTGKAQSISNRAVRLPVQEFYPMTRFEYELPAACGNYTFRVYESGTTEILEYALVGADGTELSIRDYIAGTNPFIKPGLWTALDHTADSVSFMMTDFAETKSLIIPEVYSKGLVTGLPESLQRELGAKYRQAVHAAALCEGQSEIVARK